jgi:hypothetical protein
MIGFAGNNSKARKKERNHGERPCKSHDHNINHLFPALSPSEISLVPAYRASM